MLPVIAVQYRIHNNFLTPFVYNFKFRATLISIYTDPIFSLRKGCNQYELIRN